MPILAVTYLLQAEIVDLCRRLAKKYPRSTPAGKAVKGTETQGFNAYVSMFGLKAQLIRWLRLTASLVALTTKKHWMTTIMRKSSGTNPTDRTRVIVMM